MYLVGSMAPNMKKLKSNKDLLSNSSKRTKLSANHSKTVEGKNHCDLKYCSRKGVRGKKQSL